MTRDLGSLTWPMRTARLSIRRATEGDLEATWEFRRQPEVSEWLTRLPTDLDAYREQYLDPERLAKTLIVEHDGVVVGDLMFALEDPWAQDEIKDRAKGTQSELGWVIAPGHTGQGYASEAAAEMLRISFEDLGLRRVIAQCFADNVASWKLMEKLGMRREDHAVQESLHRTRGWLDGFRYAILADEWRARRTENA
jgi:RimJ/RimL family protein N-acetyltransferase